VRKELFLVFISALLFIVPVLWTVRNLHFRLDTDYDAHLPIYDYLVDQIRTHNTIPLINPYIATGMPVIGDPLSQALNPFFMVPLVLFGVDIGIGVVFVIVTIGAGFAMWILLTGLGIRGSPRLWGAILYEVSGALPARIAAGHVEKFFTFPLLPLFFWSILSTRVSISRIVVASLVVACLFYTGDVYSIWMVLLLFVVTRWQYLFQRKTSIVREGVAVLLLCGGSLLLSLPKLIPFLTMVRPIFSRFFPINPFIGSIHFFLTPLAFILPFQSSFYDRPSLQRLFGFHYNWYEYFAFISPMAFLPLLSLRRSWKKPIVPTLLLLLVVGALYISLGYRYSPFYWLFTRIPVLHIFRVPQRMLLVLLPLVILLLAICAQTWRESMRSKWSRVPLFFTFVISIFWTTVVSQHILVKAFEPKRQREEALVHELRRQDGSNFSVATFVCCMQRFLMKEKIANINYYYAWRPKDAPSFITSHSDSDFSPLAFVWPRYVIAQLTQDFSQYSYQLFFETPVARVWKTDTPTITP